jgi:hypothetical protein
MAIADPSCTLKEIGVKIDPDALFQHLHDRYNLYIVK